jgi:hypothetical protein
MRGLPEDVWKIIWREITNWVGLTGYLNWMRTSYLGKTFSVF